jgi:hypothetical protein
MGKLSGGLEGTDDMALPLMDRSRTELMGERRDGMTLT